MDVFSRILKEADKFMRETGKPPTRVYLGYEERDLLKLANKGNSLFFISPTDERPRVCGLIMYIVDDDNHLGVGV